MPFSHLPPWLSRAFGSFTAWLDRVTVNAVMAHRRSRARREAGHENALRSRLDPRALDETLQRQGSAGVLYDERRRVGGPGIYQRCGDVLQALLQLALRHELRQMGDGRICAEHQRDEKHEGHDYEQHHRTSVTPSNMSAGK